jgi:hypothetical protein
VTDIPTCCVQLEQSPRIADQLIHERSERTLQNRIGRTEWIDLHHLRRNE